MRRTEDEVVFGALEAFWSHSLAGEMLRVARDAETAAQAHAELASELVEAGRPFVAIDSSVDARDRDVTGGLLLVGDATDEEVLERAGIASAHVLATALSDDATNVFVTLTARAMNADMMIIARGDDRRTESKLLGCGADTVILPTEIGAAKMFRLIAQPSAEELLKRIGDSGDVDLLQADVHTPDAVADATPTVGAVQGYATLVGQAQHESILVQLSGSSGAPVEADMAVENAVS